MGQLKLDLENCHGIRRLKHDVTLSNKQSAAIYAPNGAMKSSLARTLADIQLEEETKDHLNPDRQTRREVQWGDTPLGSDEVVVVHPLDEEIEPSSRTANLLVSRELQKEYGDLQAELDDAIAALSKAIKKTTKMRGDPAAIISAAFTKSDTQLQKAVLRIEPELSTQTEHPLSEVPYDIVFNDAVRGFLNTDVVQNALEDYITKLDEILAKSQYFSPDTFSHYDADQVAKALVKHGFFAKEHQVRLRGEDGTSTEYVSSDDELAALVSAERKSIEEDPELKEKFTKIDALVHKNQGLREFKQVLQRNPGWIRWMNRLPEFEEEVLKSYLILHRSLFESLASTIQRTSARRAEIQEAAKSQGQAWQRVLDIFNTRFDVPFEVSIGNHVDVVLGTQSIPQLEFVPSGADDPAPMASGEIARFLSQGERKALYLLHIIFEIEARKAGEERTLFVFDDVADSFDYHNKYAIIQYLEDVRGHDSFAQLILTHNFDFFRAIRGRVAHYDSCLEARKVDSGILLQKMEGVNNVFTTMWKPQLFEDGNERLASIAFARNLVEYTQGSDHEYFGQLTSLLHWKPETDKISQATLDATYASVFQIEGNFAGTGGSVAAAITVAAQAIVDNADPADLAGKVVVAMAIRLHADRYMIERIADDEATGKINSNQTGKLFGLFKKKFPEEIDKIGVLGRVCIMTPGTLHLNNFMYEPLVDMGDHHLRSLHQDVCALAAAT